MDYQITWRDRQNKNKFEISEKYIDFIIGLFIGVITTLSMITTIYGL